MKRKSLALYAIIVTLMVIFSGCSKKNELTKVRLNEVVHSIFYAPQYVAIEKGFFTDESIEIQLDVGQGADKSMAALLSNNADMALLGTEAGIYVYNEGKENFAVPFAQLTQSAGNFLVSRTTEENFTWKNVSGKTIIGGRAGGMPQMILEYICRENGIEPGKDVEILTNLQYTSTAGAFTSGMGDYTAEFDPSAYNLEKEKKGYVVASMGVDSGKVPYTVYMSTKEYIGKNPETVQKFTNAVYKGQQWVKEHSPEEIAQVIKPHFPDSTIEDLTFMVKRYKEQESWKESPLFEEDGFVLIQDIMEQSGQLSKRIEYTEFINTDFAQNALKN